MTKPSKTQIAIADRPNNGKQKTYCFTPIPNLKRQPETFLPNEDTACRAYGDGREK